jgi:hypothetical protein
MSGNSFRASGTWTTPSATILADRHESIADPSNVIEPLDTGMTPEIALNVVVQAVEDF